MAASKPRKSRKKTAPRAEPPAPPDTPDSARFVQDIATRGEAAEPAKDGTLPLDATFAIVKKNPDGTIRQVKRARFKLY